MNQRVMKTSITPTESGRAGMRLPRFTWGVCLGIAMSLGFAAVADDAEPSAARAVIDRTVEQVLAVLRDTDRTVEERRAGIEEIAYARFDLRTMSRLVLSRNWKKFSPAQQDEYVSQFRQYLATNYGSRIDRYNREEIDIVGERTEPRGDVTIKTKIVGGEFANATVDYRLRESGGEWRVIDVIVEGISLVSNYRDQFKEVLSREGPEGLLKRLRDKNAAGSSADI